MSALATPEPWSAVRYLRLSKAVFGDDRNSVDRQTKMTDELAAREGISIVATVIDTDESAYIDARERQGKGERPGLPQVRDHLASGAANCVLVYHTDRMFRDEGERSLFVRFCRKNNIHRFITCYGEFDPFNPDHDMQQGMLTLFAKWESATKSRRICDMVQDRVDHGLGLGSDFASFGYEGVGEPRSRKMTVVESEAKLIRDAAEQIINGTGSLASVCKEWEASGVPTSRGGKWQTRTIKGILMSPRIAGYRVHKGEIARKGEWEPILDEVTWRRLCKVLSQNQKRGPKASPRLLTGILECGVCGRTLGSTKRSSGSYGYICPNIHCRKTTIIGAPTEELVFEELLRVFDSKAFVKAITESNKGNVNEALRKVEEEQAELASILELAESGQLKAAEFVRLRTAVEGRLALAQNELDSIGGMEPLRQYAGKSAAFAAAWETMSTEQKRFILAIVFGTIVVTKAEGQGSRALARKEEVAKRLKIQTTFS